MKLFRQLYIWMAHLYRKEGYGLGASGMYGVVN